MEARSRLLKLERARQSLSQREVVVLANDQLTAKGYDTITRAHYANIESARRNLSEPVLRAIAAALGIPEAQLRHPQSELWAAA